MKVIDCDLLARRIVEPGKPAYRQIVERFGKEILENLEVGAPIDRKVLGEVGISLCCT